ncbi:phosphoribosylformylglycinamidine synthase subunit PurL [Geothrix campi]|uniref:phosphoribosylformylglycinamidine synthase subunit PurL n=1 Tax=Geothrix campi TaxID=2966450 RepID=UPI002148AF1F|nr:phosphoribosylformylglycinamidine synthase subunit PurL [Geothrix sp. SG10]
MSVAHEPAVTESLALELGLSKDEWQVLLRLLDGRLPTYPELGVFSAMWSEHCSYKSSRIHLKNLPTEGPRVIQGPGENAGVVDLGDGWAVAFKMESHNHPSFIEPYQGAATGVGGILRDVFTMGARPLANLNSLRFGELDAPRMKGLVKGVAAGIAGYGNCMGIPMLGGDCAFDASYNGNILVNAFTLGVLRSDKIFKGFASGIGNKMMYIGSKTGRDGIHGASMASAEFGEGSEEKRPTVQVGDPFTEKLLLEACLEIFQTDWVIGIQDMGAAGLTSSSFEMASRAGTGLEIRLDQVPMREEGMTPFELMLSESQERMLLVARPGCEDKIIAVLHKWGLDACVVGEVTDSGRFIGSWHGEPVINLPIQPLVDAAPKYDRPRQRPGYLDAVAAAPLPTDLKPTEVERTLRQLIQQPTVASKRWIFEQYDGTVRSNTLLGMGRGDAGIIRVKDEAGQDTGKAVAMSSDCNSRFCYLDPFWGAAHAVAEACRNLACVGAEPIGLTDCLNYGNPEKPENMWTFEQGCLGIRQACLALDVPIVSGNVSLYNDTEGQSIFPTPMIAAVGLVEDCAGQVAVDAPDATALSKVGNRICGSAFRAAHDGIFLLGETRDELGGSEYLKLRTGKVQGACPELRLDEELRLQACVREGIRLGLIRSAHDASEGGLVVAALESAFGANDGEGMGCQLLLTRGALRLDSLLFGETAGRIVVSVSPEAEGSLATLCATHRVPCAKIGATGGSRITLAVDGQPLLDADAADLKDLHAGALERALG